MSATVSVEATFKRYRRICISSATSPRSGPIEKPKAMLAKLLLRGGRGSPLLNEHITHPGDIVFRHACKMGLEGIVSKRLGSRYTSGRSRDWLKFKNPDAPAVKREAEENWSRERQR
jgi:bifunctional non-homologous end joining protein LigD